MLSKADFDKAIQNWSQIKGDYTVIKQLFNTAAAASFNRDDRKWLDEHNASSTFRVYAGLLDNQFLLIVAPLDASGSIIDLAEYLAKPMLPLTSGITLTQTKVLERTRTTVLSNDLRVISEHEDLNLPFENEPSLSENASIKEIQAWHYNCLDWFYHESNEQGGKRIFNYFRVPYSDLGKEDSDIDEVLCVFGLKYTAIYNSTIPILIFVAQRSNQAHAELFVGEGDDSGSSGNSSDFTHPCPPFCGG